VTRWGERRRHALKRVPVVYELAERSQKKRRWSITNPLAVRIVFREMVRGKADGGRF